MTKILNFDNKGGTFNDNSESVITFSPEGTRVEQHHQAPEGGARSKGQGARGMSSGQLVLLFSELLGASLDSTYGNPSQLADLIAKVVGGNSETIRQKIMEIGKMTDYGKQVKADAEMVAKLIEPYKPKLATDLRNTYVDD